MTLPYRWHPDGTKPIGNADKLEPGMLVPFEHQVYRVVEVRRRNDDELDRPEYLRRIYAVVLRPIEITSDDPRARDHDRHRGSRKHQIWYIYPNEHYPICATCHEPTPCRDQMAEKHAARGAEEFSRYTMAGVCPACQEPVTKRQKSMTWEDNAVVPGGPPVTFHMRYTCRGYARSYEQQWIQLDPERRKAVLTCAGSYTGHYDGSMDCTELDACPGRDASHRSGVNHYPGHSTCYCVGGDRSE